MRVLEEVSTNARFNPSDYLGPLLTLLRRKTGAGAVAEAAVEGDWSEAWRKLEEVRLALARNLARAVIVGFDNPF
jgi:nuclear pore complex protein Nup85